MGSEIGEQKEKKGAKRVYFMSTTICEDRLSSHAMNVGLIEDEGRRLEDREEIGGGEMEMVAYCNVEYKKRLFVAAICLSVRRITTPDYYSQLWCSHEDASLRVATSQPVNVVNGERGDSQSSL